MKRIVKTIRKKWAEYLLEIIVIVGSILGAFALDQWNEDKKDRQTELTVLRNIHLDLKIEQETLREIIKTRENKAKSARKMVDYHKGVKMVNLNDYYYHLINVVIILTHHPHNNSFKELINSGKLSLLNNEELKLIMMEIESDYKRLIDAEQHLLEDNRFYLFENYDDIIDYEDALTVWLDSAATLKLSKSDVEMALKKRSIRNGFFLAASNNEYIIGMLQEILEKVKTATALADPEVN